MGQATLVHHVQRCADKGSTSFESVDWRQMGLIDLQQGLITKSLHVPKSAIRDAKCMGRLIEIQCSVFSHAFTRVEQAPLPA